MQIWIMPKVKRIRLRVNQKIETYLLGIVSAEPDYKLCLAINKTLKINLRNNSPVVIPNDLSELTFSRFSGSKSHENHPFDFISNRSGKNILIKQYKNIDYFLVIHDPDNESNADVISTDLRNTEHITAVFNLDPEGIRDKNIQYLIH